ncbi:MAG: DNA repair protein RecN [Acidobacteria bacterium]|nr:DNA repair protein RecN [Acidobacteriota bacterium]
MLSLLKIKNVALIDELEIEFGSGLGLLTGETGSGKSIIVDSLGALAGARVSADLVKQGAETAQIEGIFNVGKVPQLVDVLEAAGIDPSSELIIRREISLAGKNRVFVNNRLVTQGVLREIGIFLADIHGQGEQASLYDVETHLSMLDEFSGLGAEMARVETAYAEWSSIKAELDNLNRDESEKLQLLDILKFQVDEIDKADLSPGEDAELEDEKRRLNNVEKLSALSGEAHALLYESESSTLSTLDRAARMIAELAEYENTFRGFEDQLSAARAVIEELGSTARDFSGSLEFSPARLNEIEDRLAEISRMKRKYGETLEKVLEHRDVSKQRLDSIEMSEFREEQLRKQLGEAERKYLAAAAELTKTRRMNAAKLESEVEADLQDVALEKAKFKVRFETAEVYSANGVDRVEFYFSANPGEPPRPLARVASGGEASRVMLVLKTVSHSNEPGKTAVFDEIDIGIGGRVAEAVGRKLKALSTTQQVFCVTHQPQIASLADEHFVVEKAVKNGKTSVLVRRLGENERIEELARMLAGAEITDHARENARSMLESARRGRGKAQKG